MNTENQDFAWTGYSLTRFALPTNTMQSFPPKDGRGSVHVRARSCVPAPHVVEHGDQSFQSLHSPSTEREIILNIR